MSLMAKLPSKQQQQVQGLLMRVMKAHSGRLGWLWAGHVPASPCHAAGRLGAGICATPGEAAGHPEQAEAGW